jgi:hypothetical protein
LFRNKKGFDFQFAGRVKSSVALWWEEETFPIGLANRLAPISEFEFGSDGFFGVHKSACSAGVACPQIQPALPLYYMRFLQG